MNKKYTFLLSILFFTSIVIASEEPDEKINIKTPNDASKIIPGSEEAEQHALNKSSTNCRIGRKRRRQSTLVERKKWPQNSAQNKEKS
jgi:hypothetical protein